MSWLLVITGHDDDEVVSIEWCRDFMSQEEGKRQSLELRAGLLFAWVSCRPCILKLFLLHFALAFWNQTWRTLLERLVFWARALRSLASGFWLMAKYCFIVRSWWCLKEVLILLVLPDPPDPVKDDGPEDPDPSEGMYIERPSHAVRNMNSKIICKCFSERHDTVAAPLNKQENSFRSKRRQEVSRVWFSFELSLLLCLWVSLFLCETSSKKEFSQWISGQEETKKQAKRSAGGSSFEVTASRG